MFGMWDSSSPIFEAASTSTHFHVLSLVSSNDFALCVSSSYFFWHARKSSGSRSWNIFRTLDVSSFTVRFQWLLVFSSSASNIRGRITCRFCVAIITTWSLFQRNSARSATWMIQFQYNFSNTKGIMENYWFHKWGMCKMTPDLISGWKQRITHCIYFNCFEYMLKNPHTKYKGREPLYKMKSQNNIRDNIWSRYQTKRLNLWKRKNEERTWIIIQDETPE